MKDCKLKSDLVQETFEWYKIYRERYRAGQVKGSLMKDWWLYNNQLSEIQCFLMWLQEELLKIQKRKKK